MCRMERSSSELYHKFLLGAGCLDSTGAEKRLRANTAHDPAYNHNPQMPVKARADVSPNVDSRL
jgi:hypothetical protein